ncbi:MAG: helix-turn-helix domain-containing protein [Candidatus Accumulibacter sp.]|jgi:cytoskeleton protein RodZ|nr:helix-turn-helix domain-containing protein [Accumulibacter sp.]
MNEKKAVPDSMVVPERDGMVVREGDEMVAPERDGMIVSERDGWDPVLADDAFDVGQHLRQAREARGVSIGEAAKALKLSPRQVDALEANDWSQLPRTVTRGFIRNYARYLEIDFGPLMVALDRAPMPRGPDLVVSAASSINMPREGQGDRLRDYARVLAGLIVLALALLASFFVVPAETWQSGLESIKALVSEKDADLDPPVEPAGVIGEAPNVIRASMEPVSSAAPLPPETPSPATAAPAPVEAVPVPTPPTPPTPPISPTPPIPSIPLAPLPPIADQPAPLQPAAALPALVEPGVKAPAAASPTDGSLAFSFAENSWVEVRDRDGQVIFSQLNPAGSQREITGQPPFALVIGNASQVTLQYQGKPVDLSPRSSKDNVARLTLE